MIFLKDRFMPSESTAYRDPIAIIVIIELIAGYARNKVIGRNKTSHSIITTFVPPNEDLYGLSIRIFFNRSLLCYTPSL